MFRNVIAFYINFGCAQKSFTLISNLHFKHGSCTFIWSGNTLGSEWCSRRLGNSLNFLGLLLLFLSCLSLRSIEVIIRFICRNVVLLLELFDGQLLDLCNHKVISSLDDNHAVDESDYDDASEDSTTYKEPESFGVLNILFFNRGTSVQIFISFLD